MVDLANTVERAARKSHAARRRYVPRQGMTLGFRLNLSITLLLVLILALGTASVIHRARHAVAEETQASAALVRQFLTVAEASTSGAHNNRLWEELVHHIGELETTRHLAISLHDRDGGVVASVNSGAESEVTDAPAWFTRLVTPKPVEYRRDLSDTTDPDREIVIRSNPAGEITEAWNDARPLLALQFLFALLVEALVFITVGRAQRPLDRLLRALEQIEQGHFQTRLPQFKLPELASISHKFNRMAEALEQEKDANRRLARRALSIQEEERRHMAHELHDELGQSMSATKALAVSIRRRAGENAQRVRENAESIVRIADQTHTVIRTMVYRLRPPALDELGLVSALQRMVDEWNSQRGDIFCYLRTQPAMPALGDDITINLYRIVQECLTNVATHACASHVNIHLRTQSGDDGRIRHLLLDVHDDGVGLRVERKYWGLGLRGIHDRVAALDGEIEVSGRARGGTSLRIVLPIATAEEIQ